MGRLFEAEGIIRQEGDCKREDCSNTQFVAQSGQDSSTVPWVWVMDSWGSEEAAEWSAAMRRYSAAKAKAHLFPRYVIMRDSEAAFTILNSLVQPPEFVTAPIYWIWLSKASLECVGKGGTPPRGAGPVRVVRTRVNIGRNAGFGLVRYR